jgi:hypothetical protein
MSKDPYAHLKTGRYSNIDMAGGPLPKEEMIANAEALADALGIEATHAGGSRLSKVVRLLLSLPPGELADRVKEIQQTT